MLSSRIFDNARKDSFTFKKVEGTSYLLVKPNDCDLFNDFELRPVDKLSSFKKQCIGAIEGVFIIFFSDKHSSSQSTPKLYLDVNYAYLTIEKHRNKVAGKQDIIFQLCQRELGYEFRSTTNNNIGKKWIKYLNNYAIRLDQPISYTVSKTLGSGTYANVHLAYKMKKLDDETDERCEIAIKSISKTLIINKQLDISQLMSEITIQRKVSSCGNVVKLHKVYESENQLHLMIDYQQGGTLLDKTRNNISYSEEEIRTIMAQLFLAVDYMHQKGIIHRDLKLPNILFNSDDDQNLDLRVADFGLAV